MAYQALYRKYRPQTFSEVVGQQSIIRTLENALKENKIAHAYLFCGPRGTGKTSLARLFAKALECEEGLGHQCNKCQNCIEITNGTHPDVVEVDAASNSGVDSVRQIIEQVSYAPLHGRYKVYIIDEVHSMSSTAFNALLKTLEEPPSNVIFILATTEPNKVLPTILSRVQRFDFSKVSIDDLVSLMERILKNEKITYEEGALRVIARLSDGGVRDALSLLDEAISYSQENIKLDDVYTLFGLFRVEEELDLVRMIHQGNVKEALEFSKIRYQKGADIVKLHNDLINIYKDLLIYGTTREASLLTYLKPEEAIKVLVTPLEIRTNLDTLIASKREYKNALSSYDQFELTLLKMMLKPEVIAVNIPSAVKEDELNENNNKVENKKVEEVKENKIVEETKAPVFTKKIEVVPDNNERKETKITSSMIASNSVSGDVKKLSAIEIDEKFVLNIMVQASKEMRKEFDENWEAKLHSLNVTSPLSALANALLQTKVALVANNIVVVKSYYDKIILIINSLKNIQLSRKLLKELFNFEGSIIALKVNDFQDYVKAFTNLAQANKLPSPYPIEIRAKVEPSTSKKTNVEKFLEE